MLKQERWKNNKQRTVQFRIFYETFRHWAAGKYSKTGLIWKQDGHSNSNITTFAFRYEIYAVFPFLFVATSVKVMPRITLVSLFA